MYTRTNTSEKDYIFYVDEVDTIKRATPDFFIVTDSFCIFQNLDKSFLLLPWGRIRKLKVKNLKTIQTELYPVNSGDARHTHYSGKSPIPPLPSQASGVKRTAREGQEVHDGRECQS